MVEIRLERVTREYAGTTALDDVSFSARDGEFFTLVGPSGCGKTTTLRTIAGFETPDSGRVYFGDDDVTDRPPERRDVGIVFQNYALFPHMTVAENVAYGLRFRDPPDGVSAGRRVKELLELVDLPGMGDRDPDQLSGGQQQRIALARALAPGPRVLLLDEPMSALDARLRETLRRQVRKIQSDLSITTVYVTHDQEEALAVSDRVAVMNDGRIEQTAEPREVYRRPASRFVASFVGENNVLDGEVVAVETKGVKIAVGGSEFFVAGNSDHAVGDPATMCIRPEAFDIDTSHNRIDLEVETREFLGEADRLHCNWNGREVVVRTPDPPDDPVLTAGFDPGAVHLL